VITPPTAITSSQLVRLTLAKTRAAISRIADAEVIRRGSSPHTRLS
jgi:hypothetical protein